jgi:hypothetical protein
VPEIRSIPGIPAVEVTALSDVGLHTSEDLLRTERLALAARVPAFTLDRIKSLQSICELAQIRDISVAEAAALAVAGADSLDEFADWTIARVRAALPAASDETAAAYLKDAVRLSHTGVLNGNVRLKDGTPVEGASVTVGGAPAASDSMGRFRVLRLPLDRKVTVTVHHPTLGYVLRSGVPVLRSAALEGQAFVLSGRRQTPRVLREIDGDRLPPVGEAATATRAESGQPDPADILMVVDRYTNGDARCASRFLDFEGGRFVRRTYRIAGAALPAGVQSGDDLAWTGTFWALARYSAQEIAKRVRVRAVRRRFTAPPATEAEEIRRARAVIRAMSDPKD